jgi:hypothetical protein
MKPSKRVHKRPSKKHYQLSTEYHLKSKAIIPDDELYLGGLVHKALHDVVYRDPELIEYASEVILRRFEDKVKNELSGEAKAMVVPGRLVVLSGVKRKD